MIAFAEALEQILARTPLLDREMISLRNAAGRVLREPVVSGLTQPPFDASAMDGYAVRAHEVTAGAVLTQIGTSQAGAGFKGPMAPGECVRIFTGAPVPEDADAVVMQEETSVDGDHILFSNATEVGKSIRKRGQDFANGDEIVSSGQRLTFQHLALTAAANVALVAVSRAPNVAILATGDELVAAGSELADDQIVASNSVALSALFAPYSGGVSDRGIVADRQDDLEAAFSAALHSNADVLITTGGASVGDLDLVQPALKAIGVEIDFWRIAMRPGKPLMFGTFGDKLIFGLPGNPVSALVTAAVLVLPALRRMAGESVVTGPHLFVRLAEALPANGPRRHFMRCLLEARDGQTVAVPIAETDSGHLSSFAAADALLVRPESAEPVATGGIVEIIRLR